MGRRERVKALGRRLWDRLRGPEEEPVVSPPPVAQQQPQAVEPSLAELADLWAVRFAVDPQGKPLVVNHWATWCDGCLEEVPALVALYKKWSDRVPFVGIGWELLNGADPGAGLELVAAAHRDHGMPWRTLVYTGAADDMFVALELPSTQIPQTFVLDGDGVPKFWHLGALDERDVAELERVLGELTAG
jgi:cytochrome c biogenesis protein CcmG/thiol:disulfide interchange protein DsbE